MMMVVMMMMIMMMTGRYTVCDCVCVYVKNVNICNN